MLKKNEFLKFKKKKYSQFGEDGIIEEVFKRLEKKLDCTCVEFGAGDGINMSNTYNLIKNKNYKALLIEGNKKIFKELSKNINDKKIIKINKFVEFAGKNKLDNILKKYNFPKNFDFLSIDIDGNDYHIFEGLKIYKPKLVCIEFNPSIPNEIDFVQKKNININQGSSALSLIKLAKKKKYSPIAATEANLFFIKNSLKKYVIKNNKNYKIDDLINNKNKNFIFVAYDGSIITSKKIVLPFHKILIKEINLLPKFLKQYPANYNIFKKIILLFFCLYYNYRSFFGKGGIKEEIFNRLKSYLLKTYPKYIK
jgi:hypothetical protein